MPEYADYAGYGGIPRDDAGWNGRGKRFLAHLQQYGFDINDRVQYTYLLKWFEKENNYSPLFNELYVEAPQLLAYHYMHFVYVPAPAGAVPAGDQPQQAPAEPMYRLDLLVDDDRDDDIEPRGR